MSNWQNKTAHHSKSIWTIPCHEILRLGSYIEWSSCAAHHVRLVVFSFLLVKQQAITIPGSKQIIFDVLAGLFSQVERPSLMSMDIRYEESTYYLNDSRYFQPITAFASMSLFYWQWYVFHTIAISECKGSVSIAGPLATHPGRYPKIETRYPSIVVEPPSYLIRRND